MLSPRSHALLSALLNGLAEHRHLLTLHTGHPASTVVDRAEGDFTVEHAAVVERLCAALAEGAPAAVVLRSFTDRVSHTLADGTAIPAEVVRGWTAGGGALLPLDEARMFDAHCTDAASGEPLPPERGVVYADAPEIDLTVFRAL
ncbi:hypothetical protein [Nocardiopsis sp. CNT312]|uniref:hypothetical protein n=1 Tax=Nocardiopsis sp. CNT312 TaxID=1137268 RepID=UPI00048DA5E5|nr:hypothetical protein [Nocardiopsis sp. CNT312]